MRKGNCRRETKETRIEVAVCLDGGPVAVDTGIGFFDHMLEAFAVHGGLGLTLKAEGDLRVDGHHTVEDTGIVLGEAFCRALGDKAGITRFADAAIAMDETLVMAAVDISGRGQAYCELPVPTERVGTFDTELAVEFFYAFARWGLTKCRPPSPRPMGRLSGRTRCPRWPSAAWRCAGFSSSSKGC